MRLQLRAAPKGHISAQKVSPRTGHPTHDQRTDWGTTEPPSAPDPTCQWAREALAVPGKKERGAGYWQLCSAVHGWLQGAGCPAAAFSREPRRGQPVCAGAAGLVLLCRGRGRGAGLERGSISPCHHVLPTVTLFLRQQVLLAATSAAAAVRGHAEHLHHWDFQSRPGFWHFS